MAQAVAKLSGARPGGAAGIVHRLSQSPEQILALLATVLDSTADPIHVKDAEGRYVLINRRAEDLVGLAGAHVQGRTVHDIVAANIAERSHADDRAVMASGEPLDSEWQMPLDGRPRVFDVRKAPWRDEDGRVLGVVTVARDVTDRREAEQRAFAAERQRAMGLLAAGVAHDLRNLLQIAIARVEIGAKLAEGDPVLGPQLLGAAEALEHAAELSTRLGTLGGSAGSRRPVDVRRVLRRSLDALDSSGGRIVVVSRLDTAVPPVLGDDVELGRAYLNLVENALEAMTEGGILTVAARAERGQVITEVADTGPGMDAGTLSRAFAPFFTTKAERGTGLGLAVVQRVVADHGGRVDVWSRPGQGTRVTVALPGA
ncbi:MAG: PAS domain-containing protein [Deltaproteobacteria bacterium]|nr:PAS domain-containing protein [Deltaproteobacteria bacterium]